MRLLIKPSVAIASIALLFVSLAFIKPYKKSSNNSVATTKPVQPKIQVAILLDVSGSMSGLIEQAKAQLWNMVSVMGKAKCQNYNAPPQIEIALYEYGRDNNDVSKGYIKQLSPFTNDLDAVSQTLFKLSTNGGSEYCGHVIYTSLQELQWDTASENYKVIFIAGNEDFLQGSVTYTKACEEAKKKGVVVNTIYCGDKEQGIREHWNLGNECGMGSFTHINHNAALEEIPTPYDSTLYTLNIKLNGTYIGYGAQGQANIIRQQEVDEKNFAMNKKAAYERTAVKGKSSLYRNSSWDLVDAYADDKEVIKKLDVKTLPDSLQKKSKGEIETVVKAKQQQRTSIQKEIAETNVKRESYIAAERAKKSNITATLESEIEKIVRQQAKKYKMEIQ
jgi:hypothetical protein